jgi:hypothetical protein
MFVDKNVLLIKKRVKRALWTPWKNPMPTPHPAVLPECPPLAQSPLSADMQSPE